MYRKLGLVAMALLLTVISQQPSWAGKVWDKIKQTGVINAGTRKDAIPFGFVDSQGQWVGYSLDVLELIRKQAEKQLGKPIKLNLVEVTPENRFEQVKNGSIDIECGSTTMTWQREKDVDFSVSYFASGTQILVKKGSNLGTIESLAGAKIAVIPNTTNEKVIRQQQPAAQLVMVKDRQEGLAKLEKGQVDGFASDGIILEGLRKKATNPKGWEIVPEFPYMYESYACVLPQDESQWRDLVNYTLIKFMGGIVSDQMSSVSIYEKWFGDDSPAPYSRDTINDYFQGIVDSHEWIPLFDN